MAGRFRLLRGLLVLVAQFHRAVLNRPASVVAPLIRPTQRVSPLAGYDIAGSFPLKPLPHKGFKNDFF
jgi:hypothetical protein